LTTERFNQLFKFTCVRNPWERAISCYFSPHRGPVQWNRDQFIRFLPEISPLRKHLSLDGIGADFSNIDFFIRFENLNDDFREACGLIGLPWTPLPVRNKSAKQHYTSYYDDELIGIVRNRYCDEITHFGYEYESISQPLPDCVSPV
ncbi:MAG: sulfotransferase family protein, partial [Gammaproteobacteria bacterium]|nr:sulfotransferase family protein [Gammaproteobacteria bacterium]